MNNDKKPNGCVDHIARKNMLEAKIINEPVDIVFTSYPESLELFTECDDEHRLIERIVGWHHDRNLINGSTDKDQFCKLMQEAGELSDSICKNRDVSDDIGDMIVVLINIAERNRLSIYECLDKAWKDIKDRKGRMIDGVFVKESDL